MALALAEPALLLAGTRKTKTTTTAPPSPPLTPQQKQNQQIWKWAKIILIVIGVLLVVLFLYNLVSNFFKCDPSSNSLWCSAQDAWTQIKNGVKTAADNIWLTLGIIAAGVLAAIGLSRAGGGGNPTGGGETGGGGGEHGGGGEEGGGGEHGGGDEHPGEHPGDHPVELAVGARAPAALAVPMARAAPTSPINGGYVQQVLAHERYEAANVCQRQPCPLPRRPQ